MDQGDLAATTFDVTFVKLCLSAGSVLRLFQSSTDAFYGLGPGSRAMFFVTELAGESLLITVDAQPQSALVAFVHRAETALFRIRLVR